MTQDFRTPDEVEWAERLEAYIRPYVIALLRITVAAYERERREDRVLAAMKFADDSDEDVRALLRPRPSGDERRAA